MLKDVVFQNFLRQRPICVMVRATLERMLSAARLDELFKSVALVQYSRKLLFSQLVELMGRVVTRVNGSVLSAYEALSEVFNVSDEAVYQKLRGVEPRVCQAVVRHSFAEASGVLREMKALDEDWVSGLSTKILDGNHLAATEHRIKELWSIWEAPLPGVSLVVWDQPTRLVRDVFLSEDGHAQERSLLGQLQETIEADDLWIADRNFCTLVLMYCLFGRKAWFLIRQHGQLKGRLSGKRRLAGQTAEGQPIYEQTLILTREGVDQRVRRITVCLATPTRDGDLEIHLLTNLPAKRVSATRAAELYRKRWTIEGVFNELTVALKCEVSTLGYPKAALFAFSIAVLLENTLVLMKRALTAAHGIEAVGQLSGHRMAAELDSAYDGMLVALPPSRWTIFARMTLVEFARTLKNMAKQVDPARYQVRKRGPKKPAPKRKRTEKEIHVSTAKILALRQNK